MLTEVEQLREQVKMHEIQASKHRQEIALLNDRLNKFEVMSSTIAQLIQVTASTPDVMAPATEVLQSSSTDSDITAFVGAQVQPTARQLRMDIQQQQQQQQYQQQEQLQYASLEHVPIMVQDALPPTPTITLSAQPSRIEHLIVEAVLNPQLGNDEEEEEEPDDDKISNASGNGANKHTCELCHKSFKYYSNYEVHLRVHSDDRPYECEVCSKRFKQKTHRNVHVKRVHEPEALTNGAGKTPAMIKV